MQHFNRSIPEARTLLNTCRLIIAHAAIIRCFIFSGVVGTSWYTMFFYVPHKKKSSDIMSGERAGHEIGPPRPIDLGRFH